MHEGASLTIAIQSAPIALRPAVQSITFQALRRGFWVHEVLNQYLQKTPPGLTKYLLWAAIALIPEKDREPMYTTHTLVNEAVNATHLDKNMSYAKGLVNAILRRILRSPDIYKEISEDDKLTCSRCKSKGHNIRTCNEREEIIKKKNNNNLKI